MKKQLYRHGVIVTTIENVDDYTTQNGTINDPPFVKKDDYEFVVKEFLEMKELFLETKLKVDELNRKVKGFKHISNLKTADAFTIVANNPELGLEKPLLDTKTKPNSTKKKEKAKTKESSAENSDDSFSKNSQTTVLTNQERKSIALSLEYTQDELDHIARAWASHNQRAKKAWKLARKYSGRAFKRKYFEIYDYIDIEVEVEAPDPSNYDAYRTRICAMIEAATAKANIPNNLLMNSKAKDTLRDYGTSLMSAS